MTRAPTQVGGSAKSTSISCNLSAVSVGCLSSEYNFDRTCGTIINFERTCGTTIMSLVWINCFRRLKLEAQDAAKEEKEKKVRQQKERKIKRTEKFVKSPNRKVSFNSIVHVNFFFRLHFK